MITAYLALAAAVLVTVAAVSGPHAAHALAPVLVAVLWAIALWAGRRARARYYHRHGRDGVTHHRRPPLRRRAWDVIARARTLRLTTTARTA